MSSSSSSSAPPSKRRKVDKGSKLGYGPLFGDLDDDSDLFSDEESGNSDEDLG